MCCSAGPSAATTAASTSAAAPTPISVERQPRTTPDREHDRQRLDRLDRAGEEGGEEEDDVVAHGSAGFR